MMNTHWDKYCPPPKLTVMQATLSFEHYIRAHPDLSHLGAAWLVENALLDDFPCQTGQEGD
jgi:Rap1a immunity proteins